MTNLPKRLRLPGIAALALLSLWAAGMALGIRAREAREEARRHLRELYLEQGRQLLFTGDWRRSLVFLGEAYRDAETDAGLRFLVARAAAPLRGESQEMAGSRVLLEMGSDESDERWLSADLSSDWTRIAALTASGQAALFDSLDGHLLLRLADTSDDLIRLRFSPDGEQIAGVRADGRRSLWRSDTGKLSFAVSGEAVAIDPPFDALLRATSAPHALLEGHAGAVCCASLSPGGGLLLTAGDDATANVWDVERGLLLGTLLLPGRDVIHAEYGPQGARIATVHADGTVDVQPLPLDDAGAAEIERLRKCYVPWRLESGRLLPATPDPRAWTRILPAWEEREEIWEPAVPEETEWTPPRPGPIVVSASRIRGLPAEGRGDKIRVVLKDADLVETLRSFARISGFNLLFAPEIRGTISADFPDVPWDHAFQEILRASELSSEESGNLMFILPQERRALPSESEVVTGQFMGWVSVSSSSQHTIDPSHDFDQFIAQFLDVPETARPPEETLDDSGPTLSGPSAQEISIFEAQEVVGEPESRALQEGYGEPIRMSLKNADLYETLASFSSISGARAMIDGDVSGSVSVELTWVPWDRALVAILRLHDLHLEISGDFWRIRRRNREEAAASREGAP